MEPTRIRYQLDEHVAHAIAHGLARRATDVATAIDSGVVALPDDQLLARCLTEGRVLITHDQDFLRLHRQGVAHAGIVFCEQRSRSIGEIVAYLSLRSKQGRRLCPGARGGGRPRADQPAQQQAGCGRGERRPS